MQMCRCTLLNRDREQTLSQSTSGEQKVPLSFWVGRRVREGIGKSSFSLGCQAILWWKNFCSKNCTFIEIEMFYETMLLLMTSLMRNISFRFFFIATYPFGFLHYTKMLILMSGLVSFNLTELGTMKDGRVTAHFGKNVRNNKDPL